MTSMEISSSVGPTVRVTHFCHIGLSRSIPAVGHPDETRAFALNQALPKANRGAVLGDLCASLAEAGGDEAVQCLDQSMVEHRMDELFGIVGACVSVQAARLKDGVRGAMTEAMEEARACGVHVSWTSRIEAVAPGTVLHAAPDNIRERVKQVLGLSRAFYFAPVDPFVHVNYQVMLSGPDGDVDRLGRKLADHLASLMPAGTERPTVRSETQTETVYPGATYEECVRNRLATRRPLPPTGEAFMSGVREARRAIEAGDAVAAFAAADDIARLVRRDPVMTALLLRGDRPGDGSKRFEVGNARKLARHIACVVATLKAQDDLEGLRGLLFAPSGMVETIREKVWYELAANRLPQYHAKPIRAAFGDVGNAQLHFEAFDVDGQRRPAATNGPIDREQALLDFIAAGAPDQETAPSPDDRPGLDGPSPSI
ncbi:hypothetical protein M6G65_17580 [Methylobacterium tardum]|uniref:hypothetical protein n=1 Tax=Methylobacterium tardum TaxID=374432 RepID=UPI0020213766|nr:hypothetical protein [Methylobacterium tardum]URD34430.1 hypothetical protein M6G65_17580 [Methylobacterium tardum]